MKLLRFLFIILLVAVSCAKEIPSDVQEVPSGALVTIRVSVPENPFSKVSLIDEDNSLKLSWQEGDCLRVISGGDSQVFTISNIISAHEAEFTGPAVAGSSFDILLPGTYESVQAAEKDLESPAQSGNGSTSHLRYKALLSGVDSYTDIAFTDDWASSHGGSLGQSAAIKLKATLPEGVTSLKKAYLRIAGKDYTLPLSGVDVSEASGVLTAYMMLPWQDIPLPAGSSIVVCALATDNEAYSASLPISGDRAILCGRLNTILGVNLSLSDFVAGDGTEENPYLIANARQLNNLKNIYVGAENPAESGTFKKYFRLIEDVDASGINWTPINASGKFYKAMDFDGGGHTISNLSSSGTYASFAGVVYGDIRNVTFSGATIQGGGTKCGVVGGFIGTDLLPGSCENVVVTGCSVTGTSYVGGFAGHVRTTGTLTGCRVENSTLTGTNYMGGFTAQVDIGGNDKYEVPAIFTDCHVTDVTINQNCSSAGEMFTGGFVGYTAVLASFIDCSVKASISATQAAVKDIGGFVGRTTYVGPTFTRCAVLPGSSVTAKGQHVGGFVGYSECSTSYNACSSAATVSNAAEYTGGFAGFACGSSAFRDCTASGNVTGLKHTGGFAGIGENASFSSCKYVGGTVTENVSGRADSAGFCGYVTSGVSFRNCSVENATVAANSGQRIGGFIGQLGASYSASNNVSLSGCYVQGTSVTGSTNTGGFVGVQYDNIERSYVSGGSVTARNNNCGGFSAYVQQGTDTNCFTTATVNGGSYSSIGGFAGVSYQTTISSCYAAGSITASGSNIGAFVGQCAKQGSNPASTYENCIGWHASLPFYGANTVGATITNCYAGNEGSVSAQAASLGWDSGAWDITSGALPVLKAGASRVTAVFIGDSITWQWARNSTTFASSKLEIPFDSSYMTQSGDNISVPFHPGFFAGNGYIDKGISGQNTTQMLARFRKDVIELNPVVAVIMGGTNDLAQGVTKEQILANLSAMAEMADEAGIKVVLCSVTPCNETYNRLSNPKTKGAHIIALNGMIQDYVESKGFTYCDYWSSLVAEDGLALAEEYRLYDKLHPGPVGYDVMEGIIKPIIDSLL